MKTLKNEVIRYLEEKLDNGWSRNQLMNLLQKRFRLSVSGTPNLICGKIRNGNAADEIMIIADDYLF